MPCLPLLELPQGRGGRRERGTMMLHHTGQAPRLAQSSYFAWLLGSCAFPCLGSLREGLLLL